MPLARMHEEWERIMPKIPRTWMAHPLTEYRISIDDEACLLVALRRYLNDEEFALKEGLHQGNAVDGITSNIAGTKRLLAVIETAWSGGNARIVWGDE